MTIISTMKAAIQVIQIYFYNKPILFLRYNL